VKYLLYMTIVVAAWLGGSPAQAQAQVCCYPGYATNIYPPPGSPWYWVPRVPYFAPPLTVIPPVIYVQPPSIYSQPIVPNVVAPGDANKAPPGYRWGNVWDTNCQCNRAVLIPQ
jgi:hypothetical protein